MRFLDRIMTGSALAVLALAAASGATAQDAPPPAAPAPAQPASPPADDAAAQDGAQDDAASEDEADEVGEVLVTGARNAVRTSIDSVSYSLADDLQTTSGTLADALRNIPSVDVDPEGNLSLRGDQNVTVLVDGRPSALFAGQSRAQVLLSIPADRYARIEVMTNPSAAYSPEGTGGVINLISKPNVTPPGQTATGSIRANVGNDGRWNLGANIVRSAGKTTLSGDLGLRNDSYIQELERARRVGAVGDPDRLDVDQTRTVDGDADVIFARGGIEHNLDDKTQLTGELRHTDVDSTGEALDLYTAVDRDGDIASA